MKILYIADDGKKFDDEFDCIHYEWEQQHIELKKIKFLDKNNNELEDFFSDDTYSKAERIIVPSQKAADELVELGDYTGFCCYQSVKTAGEWVFDYTKEDFVKVKEL